MSMQQLFRLTCDEPDCGRFQPTPAPSRELAREQAARLGWDVGPRQQETRRGTLIHHTDFCPQHRKSED